VNVCPPDHTQFYPAVHEHLDRRGLAMPFELPETAAKPFPEPDDQWVEIKDMHKRVEKDWPVWQAAQAASKDKGTGTGSQGGRSSWMQQRPLDNVFAGAAAGAGAAGAGAPPAAAAASASAEGGSEGGSDDKAAARAAAFASLPAHAHDHSEFFLASLIERTADSWDLHLTTFLLSHDMVLPDDMDRQVRAW